MNEIAIVTACFGGIDDLKCLPSHRAVDAFLYTDEATRNRADGSALASYTRVIVPNYPRYDFDARLRSRYFKHQIHRLDEVQRHRWLVWVDGSLQLHETHFLEEWALRLSQLPANQRVLLVPHPDRRTIYEEYRFISDEIASGNEYLRLRYEHEKMTEQMEYFRERDWSHDSRLFCGGFWMVENSELFARCWDDWWNQNIRFGMMDQLSFSLMLQNRGAEPQTLDVLLWNNPHFRYVTHNP